MAQYILENSNGTDSILHVNQTKLAAYFGVERPSLSRTLSEMIDKGIISLKGKYGKILDREKLKIKQI